MTPRQACWLTPNLDPVKGVSAEPLKGLVFVGEMLVVFAYIKRRL